MSSNLLIKSDGFIGDTLSGVFGDATMHEVERVYPSQYRPDGWGKDSVSKNFSGYCARQLSAAENAINSVLGDIERGQELRATPTCYVSQAGKINSLAPERMYDHV